MWAHSHCIWWRSFWRISCICIIVSRVKAMITRLRFGLSSFRLLLALSVRLFYARFSTNLVNRRQDKARKGSIFKSRMSKLNWLRSGIRMIHQPFHNLYKIRWVMRVLTWPPSIKIMNSKKKRTNLPTVDLCNLARCKKSAINTSQTTPTKHKVIFGSQDNVEAADSRTSSSKETKISCNVCMKMSVPTDRKSVV